MTARVAVPGPLLAALEVCHPGGPPGWLADATPRCATPGGRLDLDEDQAQQLADVVALVWWECQQAGDDELLARVSARACEKFLGTTTAVKNIDSPL